jgi:hypothetical protein
MAVGMCLMPQARDAFKQALISGKINPEHLANMTSEARHKLFSDIVGEGNAKFVNSTFEAKLLLKDQQRGYLTWAKKISGVTPEVRRDLISRVEKMDKFLNPTEEKAFLKDLASTRLGIDVSAKEAKTIATFSQKLQEFEVKRRPDNTFSSEKMRMDYGYTKYDMGEYLSGLRNRAERPTVKESLLHPIETTSKGAGIAKSVKAALDDSAIFRQGWKTLFTNPVIWQKNARTSFANLAKSGILNKDVVRETMADILSRPNFDKYTKMKLAIGNIEEAYPTSLPEKIPVAGRLFKASEQAYESFLYKTRADVADKMLQVADKSGVNIADKAQLSSIGNLINALTGRGHLGRFENGETPVVFNNIFFSIRFVKSNFDTLTAHQLQKGVTPFVRKQAAKNLVKVVMGTAAILAIADKLKPGSVELDPRSKDFGKIKIGHTRFDVSGGMSSIAVLAAQIYKNQEKSATTGIISNLGDGYGSKTAVDAFNNYFENKLSPAASVVKDLMLRHDFNGDKLTPKGEATNLLVPMPITVYTDAKNDPHSANKLILQIADGLGISTNTYGGSQKKFNTAMENSPKLVAFRQSVGADKFKQAEKSYNTKVDNWMVAHQDELNKLPQDQQQTTLNSVKTKLQNKVLKDYDFKYKAPKPTGSRKSLLESVK